ncbi:MAG: hypothetical protein ACRDQ4_17285 [Pseudonocardiaceae bacterium]
MPIPCGCGPAQRGPRRHRPPTADTTPARQQSRHRRGPGGRVRRLCPPGLTSVWPCATASHREGTGLIADWLPTAVTQIVATYTQPRDHVLWLVPPGHLNAVAERPAAGSDGWRGTGAFAGLSEAAWVVARLGRVIHPETDAWTDTAVSRPVDEPPETVGGSEPGAGHAESDRPGARTARPSRRAGADTGTGREHPDRYHLIITAIDPRVIRPAPAPGWADLLHPHGVLAVITHSDSSAGWLIDPTGAVVRAARHAGLTYLDHLALLHVPLRRGVLDTPGRVPAGAPCRSRRPVRAVRVHSDLLIFSRIPGASVRADREEIPDA